MGSKRRRHLPFHLIFHIYGKFCQLFLQYASLLATFLFPSLPQATTYINSHPDGCIIHTEFCRRGLKDENQITSLPCLNASVHFLPYLGLPSASLSPCPSPVTVALMFALLLLISYSHLGPLNFAISRAENTLSSGPTNVQRHS